MSENLQIRSGDEFSRNLAEYRTLLVVALSVSSGRLRQIIAPESGHRLSDQVANATTWHLTIDVDNSVRATLSIQLKVRPAEKLR